MMNNLFRCNICSEISEYELALMNINLDKKLEEIPREISIGFSVDHENLQEVNKHTYKSVVSFSMICCNTSEFQKDGGVHELEVEDVYFELNLRYNVNLIFEESIKLDINDKETVKAINNCSWFVLFPTLRENVNMLSSKIGIPNIYVPYSISKETNED